jgi:hypothetical protein
MITLEDANKIGQNWIDKWNEPNLTDFCELYEESAEELSSMANRLIRISNGHIKGRHILYCYWQLLRAIFPDNNYELSQVQLHGEDIVVFFKMNGLKTNAVAKLSINHQNKIERILTCHV